MSTKNEVAIMPSMVVTTGQSLIFKKNSALIQNQTTELTAVQRKIINACIYVAQRQHQSGADRIMFDTTLRDIQLLVGSKKHDYKALREQIDKLASIRIRCNYLEKDTNLEHWRSTAILSDIDIDAKGRVLFEFPSKIVDSILRPEIYSPIDQNIIRGFRTNYAIVLYEFLRDYMYVPRGAPAGYKPKIPLLELTQFREMMGIAPSEYTTIAALKVRVLESAVHEFNKNSECDIKTSFQLIKENNRRYRWIQFEAIPRSLDVKETSPDVDEEDSITVLHSIGKVSEKTIDHLVKIYGSREYVASEASLLLQQIREGRSIRSGDAWLVKACQERYGLKQHMGGDLHRTKMASEMSTDELAKKYSEAIDVLIGIPMDICDGLKKLIDERVGKRQREDGLVASSLIREEVTVDVVSEYQMSQKTPEPTTVAA